MIQDHLPLGKAHIVHVNNDYVFDGELDITQPLAIEDITDEVLELQAGLDKNLDGMSNGNYGDSYLNSINFIIKVTVTFTTH